MTLAISTTDLTKRFHREAGYKALISGILGHAQLVTAVDMVNLEVKNGELFGLLGPNGAGKTTLIKMLCTLILPTSGNASVLGHDLVREEGHVKKLVNLITADERSFYWRLTGRENLEFYACLWGLSGRQAREKADEVLRLVGLAEEGNIRFQNYSTGMRQKLAVARGLLGSPRILFMDELTKSLDPISARAIRQFVRYKVAAEGMTVIYATHHLGEAEELCDRVAIMNHGQILISGTVCEIKRTIRPLDTYHLEINNSSKMALKKLRGLPGLIHHRILDRQNGSCTLELGLVNKETLPEAIKMMAEGGVNIYSCRLSETRLEDAFLDIINKGVASK